MKTITFLLVDDDLDDTSLFEEVLSDVDPSINLRTAINGEIALKDLQKQDVLPDVIFLDLNMPRMGGKEFLYLIKQNPRLKDIPVIMYTTSSQSKDIEETLMKGAVCFITKPSSLNELQNILSSIAKSLPHNLKPALRTLSDRASTFIVC